MIKNDILVSDWKTERLVGDTRADKSVLNFAENWIKCENNYTQMAQISAIDQYAKTQQGQKKNTERPSYIL